MAPQDVGDAVAIEIADSLYLPGKVDPRIADRCADRRAIHEPKQNIARAVAPKQIRKLISVKVGHRHERPVERNDPEVGRRIQEAVAQMPDEDAPRYLVAPDDIELTIAVEIA